MKNIILTLVLFTAFLQVGAQTKRVALSYFSETVAYPGMALEFEIEKSQTNNISLSQKATLGYYSHPRNHNAIFFDIQQCFKRYLNNGLVLENSIGVGIMSSFLNEEVLDVNANGDLEEESRFAGLDFMPSISLGLGYALGKNKNDYIALRPKVFWQYPFNGRILPHTALQVSYVYKLKSNK